MRILHILSTPRAEGTPNLVLDWLATGLHEQDVFVLNDQPADLTERLRSAARWYGEGNNFSTGRRKFFAIAASVRRVCRDRRPDLVVCWPTGFANWVCLGARSAGTKRLLVHCGNPPNRGFKADWITRYVMWPLSLLGARCVCCSNYVREQFQAVPGVSRHLFNTVWNCARIEEVQQRAAAVRVNCPGRTGISAVMVATLERHKDHATALRAMPIIRQTIPNFRLRLVGDGSLRGELQRLAIELGIADAVEFLGTRRDVPEILSQCAVFIFSTTLQEGLGTVLVEALAAGLPIVASDVPACRELLANGRYGRLVQPGNPLELASAVLEVLGASSATTGGIEYARQFVPERMLQNYLDLI